MRAFLFPLLTLLTVAAFVGCDEDSSDPIGTPSSSDYAMDTANVDYKGENNVVYFDFSTGARTTLAHDTWDIAFDDDRFVIANSGTYGYGVLVCSTGVTDISRNLSHWTDSLDLADDQGWFRLITTADNVLGLNYKEGSGMSSVYTNNVYLVYTEDESFYKVQITGSLPMGAGLRMRIDSLSGDGAVEDTFETDSDYDYVYIDLGTKSAVSVAPPKDEWDVRFGRTGEFIMSSLKSGRSSVAINTIGGVGVTVVEDVQLAEVTDATAYTYSADPLAIGHDWYEYNRSDRVYELQPNVYVIKTTEGNYAKMKLLSFKGPNDESFWAVFKHYYQEDDSTTFTM